MTQPSEYPLTGGPSVRRESSEPPVPPVEGIAFWWAVLSIATGVLVAIGLVADLAWLVMVGYVVGAAAAIALALLVIRAARALDEVVRRVSRRG